MIANIKASRYPIAFREGTEKEVNTAYIWYNSSIKYRWCFYDKSATKTNIKSIYGYI